MPLRYGRLGAGRPTQHTARAGRDRRCARSKGPASRASAAWRSTPNRPLRTRAFACAILDTRQIEQVANANQLGEFSFVARPETPYVVEIADQSGGSSPWAM